MRVLHAILGVSIFLVLNGLLLSLVMTSGWLLHEPEGSIIGLVALLVNVGVLIYFGLRATG
jgi:hypothetical protein